MYSHAAASRRGWPRCLGKPHPQLFTSKAVSKQWGSSPGKREHTAAGAQGRTPLLGPARVSSQLPEGDRAASSPKRPQRRSQWSGWAHSVWLSSGAVRADRSSGRSGKDVASIPGSWEEAVAVASSEHRKKGRGPHQESCAVFLWVRPSYRLLVCL